MIEKALKELGFAENTIVVYSRLLELGSASARQLAENVGMPRPSIYDHLKMLVEQGLIVEADEEGRKIFRINDVKHLKALIKDKIEILEEEKKKIDLFAPLTKTGVDPKIRNFYGAEGIRQILKDFAWYENMEILTMWPVKEMIAVLGNYALESFNKRRIKNNNSIRAIWPQDKTIPLAQYPFIGVGKKHLRQLRISPKSTTWNMGHAIYADKVSFISSRNEAFGFIVQSKDFADLMRVQFEVIWKMSKPIKYTSPKNNSFLESL